MSLRESPCIYLKINFYLLMMSEDLTGDMLDYKDYCRQAYSEFCSDYLKGKKDTLNSRRAARKFAIGATALSAMKQFPIVDPELIWKAISRSHMFEFAGVDLEPEKLDLVVSARQSWVKSSGHAFEAMVKQECNDSLKGTDILVLLQKDLSEKIKKDKISNGSMDIQWLKQQCKTDVFDLYICKKDGEKLRVFGCIQAKTSVRDRVGRDLPASKVAMEKHFWSIIFIFDAEFLHQPKFRAMVNGNENYDEYKENGWHRAYSYEAGFNDDRIRYIGTELESFASDARAAAIDYTGENRSWLTRKYPNVL